MQLRDYQQSACNAAWSQLKTPGGGNPLIVLPTGSGKSLVIASLAKEAVESYAGRVVILAHRKELLEQNADHIRSLTDIPTGLYSAGLNRKQTNEPIIVCGIQSVYKKAGDLGARHLAIVDEVHLFPEDGEGMYQSFFSDLKTLNPNLKIIGLTATPWRTDSGKLYGRDSLFQKVTYDASISSLIADGYLCSITSDLSQVEYDTSKLHIRAGEFKSDELELLFGDQAKISGACREIVARSGGRKSILVFCSGVQHAKDIQKELEKITGEMVGLVVGETFAMERAGLLESFKNRMLRWLVNCEILTTGFNARCIDMIAILRATASPGLFAQICGRGLRVYPGKENCVILDFGSNIRRHGAIDSIDYNVRASKSEEESEAPQKTCPACNEKIPASATACECGFLFPRELKHDDKPDDESKILSEPESFVVLRQFAQRHDKKKAPEGTPPTLRIDYEVQRERSDGNLSEDTISEWVCISHPVGYARSKAYDWWRARSITGFPASVDEAVELFDSGAVATSKAIVARREGHFWRILKHELDDVPEEWGSTVESSWEESEVPF